MQEVQRGRVLVCAAPVSMSLAVLQDQRDPQAFDMHERLRGTGLSCAGVVVMMGALVDLGMHEWGWHMNKCVRGLQVQGVSRPGPC